MAEITVDGTSYTTSELRRKKIYNLLKEAGAVYERPTGQPGSVALAPVPTPTLTSKPRPARRRSGGGTG